MKQQQVVQAGVFKAQCLKIMEGVHTKKHSVIITRRGKPIAKLIPVEEEVRKPIFGCMKGTGRILGDIISPIEEEWDACSQ